MGNIEIEDGTWTLRVTHQRQGIWTAWMTRPSVLHSRFQRARLVLADERVLLVSAEQLRAALRSWLDDPTGRTHHPAKIDPEKGTVDGLPVEMTYEV
jgi:hypothetical protein